MTHVVGYARTSTGKQEIENQIRLLKERGVTRFYTDEGISGMKNAMSRPDFHRMITELTSSTEPEKIVWVFEISRIGRDWKDSINTLLELEAKNIQIHSLTETWTQTNSPDMRKLLYSIVSWLNEQEVKRLSGRVKAGLARAVAEGKILGRKRKKITQETINALIKQNKNRRQIADELNVGYSTIYRRELEWKKEKLGR
jgi:DNA invertase Pin-like site-specific DNA recombinase